MVSERILHEQAGCKECGAVERTLEVVKGQVCTMHAQEAVPMAKLDTTMLQHMRTSPNDQKLVHNALSSWLYKPALISYNTNVSGVPGH